MGTQLSPQQTEHNSPHFSAHVYCGQMAGWVKMPIGTEAGLGPGHTVLDENLDHPDRGITAARFSAQVVAKRSPISASAELLLSNRYEIIAADSTRWWPSYWFLMPVYTLYAVADHYVAGLSSLHLILI